MVFLFAVWYIWKHRNGVVFRNTNIQLNVGQRALRDALEFEHCAKTQNLSGNKVVKRIHWEKPEKGWAKLNSDGASSGNSGPAGCGGLIRNEKGEWKVGFAKKIGVTNNFIAEL